MEQELPIQIRQGRETDIPFIANSWLTSYRNSPWAKNMTNTVFFTEHRRLIDDLFATSFVDIVHDSEDDDQIIGYMVSAIIDGVKVLHYIYVKKPFRELKIAKLLLNHRGFDKKEMCVYTHITRQHDHRAEVNGLDVWLRKTEWIFNPYVLFCYGEKNEG